MSSSSSSSIKLSESYSWAYKTQSSTPTVRIETSSMPAPPPPDSLESRFPIVMISIIGILATAILLLSYYAFVTKCCLNWQRFDAIIRLHQSLRRHREDFFALHSPGSRGLEEWAIQGIPTFRYRRDQAQVSSSECAVCLNDFEEEERARLLPNCRHVFHIDCIDAWLQTHANCPLCRLEITARPPAAIDSVTELNQDRMESAVAEARQGEARVRDNGGNGGGERWPEERTRGRKLHHVSSMGDECIDRRSKGEEFGVHLMRRSFSIDSSNDRELYIAVQQILQKSPHLRKCGSDDAETSCKVRRSFFFFGPSRGSKNALLPIQNEV